MTLANRTIIDLSHPLSESTPAFPGDPAPRITIFDATDRPSTPASGISTAATWRMSVHCGTHMDAPFHFFGDATTIDRVPLEIGIGPALLVRLPWQQLARRSTSDTSRRTPSGSARLRAHRHQYRLASPLRPGRLFHCPSRDHRRGRAADGGLRRPPGRRRHPQRRPPALDAHLAILGSGAVIVENLTNLDALPGDKFELIATPLAILGRDGSPVRGAGDRVSPRLQAAVGRSPQAVGRNEEAGAMLTFT